MRPELAQMAHLLDFEGSGHGRIWVPAAPEKLPNLPIQHGIQRILRRCGPSAVLRDGLVGAIMPFRLVESAFDIGF